MYILCIHYVYIYIILCIILCIYYIVTYNNSEAKEDLPSFSMFT